MVGGFVNLLNSSVHLLTCEIKNLLNELTFPRCHTRTNHLERGLNPDGYNLRFLRITCILLKTEHFVSRKLRVEELGSVEKGSFHDAFF